jgi:hypothetical protein
MLLHLLKNTAKPLYPNLQRFSQKRRNGEAKGILSDQQHQPKEILGRLWASNSDLN